MTNDRKPEWNKAYMIISAVIFIAGLTMCMQRVWAIPSGQRIKLLRGKPVTGGEAIVSGMLVMGCGGWVMRQVYQGKWR